MPKWRQAVADEAVGWYAATHRMRVHTGVPVTRPNWHGWSATCSERLEMVAVSCEGAEASVVPFEEDAFSEVVRSGLPLHPLIAWGYADRPAFGHLATRQAYLARSWQPRGPVQPVAVVAPGAHEPNVASTYSAAGYNIFAIPGETALRTASRRAGPARNDPWVSPNTGEDEELHALWTERKRAGWWLAEVPVGFRDAPTEGAARRIDAVVVAVSGSRHSKAKCRTLRSRVEVPRARARH